MTWGVTPDYDVRVSPRLLEDEDGPMLDLLKRSTGSRSTPRAERSGSRTANAWHPGSTDSSRAAQHEPQRERMCLLSS
jgi:hypothetical protein